MLENNDKDKKEELEVELIALEFANDFKRLFFKRFGVFPVVRYDLKVPIIYSVPFDISLDKLYIIINEHYKEHYDLVGSDLSSTLRSTEIILHRHIFCKIARDAGHSYRKIGEKINKSHATVISSAKRVKDLLEVKDKKLTKIYGSILKAINVPIC